VNRRLPFRQPPGIGQHPKLEPDQLARDPELAILEAVDSALETAVAALVAANPALLGPDPFERDFDDTPAPPARLYAADAIVTMTYAMRSAIDRYRCAATFGPSDGDPIE
jgi:hypothetical protein